jgi:GAF domain-containing protein
MLFPQSPKEAERLFALHELAILDTPPSPAIDRICRIARQVFDVRMVFVTLLDAHRQWFKAKPKEAEIIETSREDAFCTYAILHEAVFVVPDAQADQTFARNRYVVGEPYIRFYAGAPLTIQRGVHLGSLYVLDTKPRESSLDQTKLLKGLSRLVVDKLWLHHLDSTGLAAIETLSAEAKERHLDFESTLLPSSDQIRAARGLLNWSIKELSEASKVSVASVKRIEGQGEISVRRESVEEIVRTFRAQGARFSFTADGIAGVSRSGLARRN